MKKVAILQSNYIPWKGYFDLIAAVDEFVIYDAVQFTRRDWRNRNKIKTPGGLQWLTVPVRVKGKYHQAIKDTEIDGSRWQFQHWKALRQNYARAAHFDDVASWLEPLYVEQEYRLLSAMNVTFIKMICNYLGIDTRISSSVEYELADDRNERLIQICKQAGATEYVSGPAASSYISELQFQQNGLALRWFDYDGYREYPQLWGEFEHGVTILDMLFNCGRDSSSYLRYQGA